MNQKTCLVFLISALCCVANTTALANDGDINIDGSVDSVEVVHAEPGDVFADSALDAVRQWRREGRTFDSNGVALGIMLPGKGTRLSPITQRLHGIKPFMPVLVRQGRDGHWLNTAAASLGGSHLLPATELFQDGSVWNDASPERRPRSS